MQTLQALANSDYQHDSRVSYKFVSNKSFGQLLDISLKNCIFLKTINSELYHTKVCFSDENSKPLDKR